MGRQGWRLQGKNFPAISSFWKLLTCLSTTPPHLPHLADLTSCCHISFSRSDPGGHPWGDLGPTWITQIVSQLKVLHFVPSAKSTRGQVFTGSRNGGRGLYPPTQTPTPVIFPEMGETD